MMRSRELGSSAAGFFGLCFVCYAATISALILGTWWVVPFVCFMLGCAFGAWAAFLLKMQWQQEEDDAL